MSQLETPQQPPKSLQLHVASSAPQYIEENVVRAIINQAASTTTSYQALQSNNYTLHDMINAAGLVYATLRIPADEQKAYSRLLGTMSSDKGTPSWSDKAKLLREYSSRFEYTTMRMRVIPSSDMVLGVDAAVSLGPSRGRSKLRPNRTPAKMLKARTPGSKVRPSPSPSRPSPPPSANTPHMPLPSRTPYVPSRPKEELDPVEYQPAAPETNSPLSPPVQQRTPGPRVEFDLPVPEALPISSVPKKLHASPYGPAMRYPTAKKTFTKKKANELHHPMNFTHLRTCEACRLKAKAAAENNPKHPYHRYSRSLSPTTAQLSSDLSEKKSARSLSPQTQDGGEEQRGAARSEATS